jgi:hypothetical protein
MRLMAWILLALLLLAGGAAVLVCVRGRSPKRFCWSCGLGRVHWPQRYSPLKALASAQADFRGNDRDGNGIQDFWRGDVSGLYGGLSVGSTEMIKLIEVSVAGADAAPTGALELGAAGPGQVAQSRYAVPAPKWGYFYRALRHSDEPPGRPDPDRFAFCAFPEDYPRHGRFTFVIDERNTLFKKDLGHDRGVDVFPADPLKDGWDRLD